MFFDAHLKVQDKKEIFDDYMQRRINIIKAYIGKFNTSLEAEAEKLLIEPEITPYKMKDELAEINKWMTANGGKPVVSQKLSIGLAGLSKDPEADFEQIQLEKEADNQFTFNEPTM